MTDGFESRLRQELQGEAGRHAAAPDLVDKMQGAAGRRAKQVRRARGVGILGAVAVITVAAVVVPAALRRVQAVESALSGVFSPSTVQFTIGSSCGTPTDAIQRGPRLWAILQSNCRIGHDSVRVTLTNPDGGEVSAAPASDNVEVDFLVGSTPAAQLVVIGDTAAYVRLDLPVLEGDSAGAMAASWDAAAQDQPQLSYLSTLASGGWVESTISALDSFQSSHGDGSPSPSDLGNLRSSLSFSWAQSWDAFTSLKEISSSDGNVEYGVTLPARNFLGTILHDVSGTLGATLPETGRAIPTLSRWVMDISPTSSIHLYMWTSDGALTKLETGDTLVPVFLTVNDNASPVAAPSGATEIDASEVQAAFGAGGIIDFGGCAPEVLIGTEPGSSNPLTTSPPPVKIIETDGCGRTISSSGTGSAAQSNLQTAMTASKAYYTNSNQAFTGITDFSAAGSITKMDTGLDFTLGASTGPHYISVSAGAQYVVLTSYAPGTSTCWGTLEITSTQSKAVLGITRAVGILYFASQVQAKDCSAGATGFKALHISATGFPTP